MMTLTFDGGLPEIKIKETTDKEVHTAVMKGFIDPPNDEMERLPINFSLTAQSRYELALYLGLDDEADLTTGLGFDGTITMKVMQSKIEDHDPEPEETPSED